MSIIEETTVGKKGEILPRKIIRDKLNINPGDKLIIEATATEMIIKKVYTIEELLNMPIIAKGTPAEHKKQIRNEKQMQEKLMD